MSLHTCTYTQKYINANFKWCRVVISVHGRLRQEDLKVRGQCELLHSKPLSQMWKERQNSFKHKTTITLTASGEKKKKQWMLKLRDFKEKWESADSTLSSPEDNYRLRKLNSSFQQVVSQAMNRTDGIFFPL